jgi:DNA-binding response OmpR family regulator
VTVFDDVHLHVDFDQQEVAVDGKFLALTPIEYHLLAALVGHQGEVLSPEEIIEMVWDEPGGLSPGRAKYVVQRLRGKLGWRDLGSPPIETVGDFGFRYRSQPCPESADRG